MLFLDLGPADLLRCISVTWLLKEWLLDWLYLLYLLLVTLLLIYNVPIKRHTSINLCLGRHILHLLFVGLFRLINLLQHFPSLHPFNWFFVCILCTLSRCSCFRRLAACLSCLVLLLLILGYFGCFLVLQYLGLCCFT